jgi:hypothetical protein
MAEPTTPLPTMTPAERRRWWGLHGATYIGSEDDKFAEDLAMRGIIRLRRPCRRTTYWIFTDIGRIVYFGRDEDAASDMNAGPDDDYNGPELIRIAAERVKTDIANLRAAAATIRGWCLYCGAQNIDYCKGGDEQGRCRFNDNPRSKRQQDGV